MSNEIIPKVNYDLFSETFSQSRKNMKWEEIEYFLEKYSEFIDEKKILDIGCWNGRLLDHFIKSQFISDIDYFWIDASVGMIDEAKKKFGTDDFQVIDMLEIDEISQKKFESVFFIASFHHLWTIDERIQVLERLKNIIVPWTYIFMTNWALESNLNKQKYADSYIENSENKFWGKDFSIKIWEFERFYHCFSLQELEFLFEKTWYEIVENKLFDNERNFVSIIKA